MTYILIATILYTSIGPVATITSLTAEFKTEEACRAAYTDLQAKHSGRGEVRGGCYPAGIVSP